MHILYFHRTQSKDGQAVHIAAMVGALRRLGHSVAMVAPPNLDQVEFGGGATRSAVLKRCLPSAAYEFLEYGYSVLEWRRLMAAARARRPDAIYQRANLFMPAGRWAARRLGVPLLLEVNAPLAEERGRYGGLALPRFAAAGERQLWGSADWVLPVTAVLAARVAEAGVPRERIRVVPNGIEPGWADAIPGREAAKRESGLEGRLVVGFVGFVREWHRAERLVRFLARPDAPPDLHFLLIGDGTTRTALEAEAQKLGVAHRMTVTGIRPRAEVPALMAAIDIAVQPDVVDYACPLKLIEYMAMGRAILAPDRANIRELVMPEQDAVLYDAAAEDGFDQGLQRLVQDPGLRRRLEDAACRAIEARGLTTTAHARTVVGLIEAASRRAGVRRLAPARSAAPS